MMTDLAEYDLLLVFTVKSPSYPSIEVTVEEQITRTPSSRIRFSIASRISVALSDTGKTRRPRSVLSLTPQSSKNSIVSAGVKRFIAP